jgi:hypothetical protein
MDAAGLPAVREAIEQSDEADLIGEPQAIMVAAALGHFGQVGRGQGRFADHLSPRKSKRCHGWSQSVQKNGRHLRRI